MPLCCLLTTGLLVYIGYKLLITLYNAFYPFFVASPIKDLVQWSGGKWAVVTGSTDGIGKAYAKQLSQRGFNLVLIARNPAKLATTAKEIAALAKNVEIMQITFDFTNTSVEDYERVIGKPLFTDRQIDIGILVNNVGASIEYTEVYHRTGGGQNLIRNIILVNCIPVSLDNVQELILCPYQMTHIVLPQMLVRKAGAIVNIGSAASVAPFGLLTVYSAAKKYIDHLTRCLQLEYAHAGVFIQTVHPFFVPTNMSKFDEAKLHAPSADRFAESALNTVGIQPITYGCWPHAIQGAIIESVPVWLAQWISWTLLKSKFNWLQPPSLPNAHRPVNFEHFERMQFCVFSKPNNYSFQYI